MRILLVLIFLAAVSCDVKIGDDALTGYICTDEQMQKAQRESEWCSNNTSYFSSHCYDTAIIRNCTKMEKEEEDE